MKSKGPSTRIKEKVNFLRKFSLSSSGGSGGKKIPVLLLSGNFLLFLVLFFYELEPAGFSLRGILPGIPVYPLLFVAFSVFSGSCLLSLKAQTARMARDSESQKETLAKTVALLEEVSGFYQSSSVISARKDESLLQDLIARESLKCLRAHRAVLFIREEGTRKPKVASVFASEAVHEAANLEEEKECAGRTIRQGKPLLLREPRDFGDLFPNGGKNRALCSLLSVPLVWLGKPLGALNVSLMNGDRKFNEKDLECLALFSHHAAAAIQHSAEGERANLNRQFDLELEKIAAALRGFSAEEQQDILERFRAILPKREALEAKGRGPETGEMERSPAPGGRPPRDRVPQGEKGGEEKIMYLTLGEEAFEFSEEFGGGGLFIRTPNPLELGEKFLLRLHNGNGDEPIEVTCKVIWTNQYGKESKHLSRGMGVKFLDLRKEDRKKLQDYLKSSPAGPEASA